MRSQSRAAGKLIFKRHANLVFYLSVYKGALAIRRIFSLVGMITKPKFSNCPNVFKIGLFR